MRELNKLEVKAVSGGKDCVYNGIGYSKGTVLKMDDGKNHVCSGNDDGEWVKPS